MHARICTRYRLHINQLKCFEITCTLPDRNNPVFDSACVGLSHVKDFFSDSYLQELISYWEKTGRSMWNWSKVKPSRRHIGIPQYSHTFYWINRKSYKLNEKTSPNKSAFLILKYPCAFLQCKLAGLVNSYYLKIKNRNFPCLLKRYLHIHYSSEHQMNMINIRRTRSQHIYRKVLILKSEERFMLFIHIYLRLVQLFIVYNFVIVFLFVQ